MPLKPPDISLVIPVYNSRDIATALCETINKSLNGLEYEVIMIDDGSRDDSGEVIRSLAMKDPRLTAIELRANYGQDNAILAGLRHARGEYIVIMDDDLQHDPQEIPKMLAECKKGYDLVYADFHQRKHSRIKNAGSRLNGGFAAWLLDKPPTLYLSPFKIMTAQLASEVAAFTGPYPYIDGILLKLKPRVSVIMAEHHQRYSGKGNYTLGKSTAVWFRLFTGFSVAPLRIATLLGLFIAFFAFLAMFYYLLDFLFTDQIVEGWITLVLLILFFGGLILCILGLIGSYIGRIYMTINGKQQYTVAGITKTTGDESPPIV